MKRKLKIILSIPYRLYHNFRFSKRNILYSLLFIILLLITLSIVYDNSQATPGLKAVEPLDIRGVQRLLVIAPHPDDETLSAAGLIQAVLKQGGDVRVIVVTNGDGQLVGPIVSEKVLIPNPQYYIQYGYLRQSEVVKALSILGVTQDKIDFLGYPDGELITFWDNYWKESKPYFGRYTFSFNSPYSNTYNQGAFYRGYDLYTDLHQIISAYQPDLVVVPHPEDDHRDHRAVSNFSRFAVADYQALTGNPVTVLGYLIHYKGYPKPRGININEILYPPHGLSNYDQDWLSYILDGEERRQKLTALNEYDTQMKLMGTYLRSFVRANELFYNLPAVRLSWFEVESDDVLEEGWQNNSFYMMVEPQREKFDRFVLAGADLVAWKAFRLGNQVCFGADTRGPITKEITYRILIKMPDGTNIKSTWKDNFPELQKKSFMSCFDLGDLGDPKVIGFSAETWAGVMLDRTIWNFVILDQ